MLILQNITYIYPGKEFLFSNINLAVNKHDKIALIGNNGSGKSTLLKIMAGELHATAGTVTAEANPYYIPQHFGQYNDLTVAQALAVDDKLKALLEILDGNVTETNLARLNDDWNIEERCNEALEHWDLKDIALNQKMETLSGGQKTKVFLAGISIHQPEIILLDEPSNHLDAAGRRLLYDFIQFTNGTLVIVSHDRRLLNMLNQVCELSKHTITVYGGNYDFYTEQKHIAKNALNLELKSKEKALRKAKEVARETVERQQKLDARGKNKQEKAGIARIMMNTLRNNAEKSTSRIKSIHTEKTGAISQELKELRTALPDLDQMKLDFGNSELYKGKILFKAEEINYSYGNKLLWKHPVNIQLNSGERIALKGQNGSGKTTLIKIITGEINPAKGSVQRAAIKPVYIDQDYSLIKNSLSVYEQAQQFNDSGLEEHEIKIRLNRFLFTAAYWEQACGSLSGGEKMRLMLCCLGISQHAPDLIIFDEPTNNLDIQNIEILTAAIRSYHGTLIIVTHDEVFLEQVKIDREIYLK